MIVAPMWTRLLVSRQTSGILAWGGISAGAGARCRVWDVLIPPVIQFCSSGFPFLRLVRFKKVDNKLIELFVVESIVIARPVGSVSESEMKLHRHNL